MNGYLMLEKEIVPGDDTFIESFSAENNYGVVFEDDGETAYFYALETDSENKEQRILDALHIYETADKAPGGQPVKLMIIWARDWSKCALVLDDFCHAVFDFEKHGGYNINEFPPPNEIWTKQERKLTNEIIQSLF
jgi:hypothetical protein